MNRKKVLAVDDDESILAMLQSGLELMGYDVNTATYEKEAWKMLESSKPDIILLDVGMPVLDGISLCKKIHSTKKYEDIPIIILTAYGDEQTYNDAILFGASTFLDKPFEIKDVEKAIETALAKKTGQGGKV